MNVARGRWSGIAAEFVVLVVLPALWWWPLLAAPFSRALLPDFMDTVTQIYPYRIEAARQLHAGVLPVWNPHQFGGHPLAANPQVAVWYPLNWLFFAWPGPWTNGVVCWLHYVIAGYGMARLVGCWTRRREAQLFAGFTFAFSAALVSRIALTPHLYTVPWMPWLLWAAERAARERDDRAMPLAIGPATLLAGVFMAMQFLAGAPQVSYYTALLLPAWWMVRRWSWRRMGHGSAMRWMIGGVARGMVAGVLAALLAGIQLIPTLEFLSHSARSSIDIDKLVGQGLNHSFILTALVGGTGPLIEDTDSIQAIGPGALALAIVALMRRRTRGAAWALVAIGVASLLLSLGALVPMWARVLPMFESFHAPRRALLWWTVAGSASAGIGAAIMGHWLRRRAVLRVVVLCVLATGTLAMLPRLERVFTDEARFQPDAAMVGELATGGRFIALDPAFNFSYDSRRSDYGRSLMPNLATWHALADANGYDPLVPRGIALLRRATCARSGVFYPSHGVFHTDPSSPYLRLLAVSHVVGRMDVFDPGRLIPGASWDREWFEDNATLAIEDERWPVWRLNQARPWAWSVERVVLVATADEAIDVAIEPRLAGVELEQVQLVENFVESFQTREVVATPRDARTWHIAIEAGRGPAFVCLAAAWMPGWVARDQRGQRLDVVRAHGCIVGVVVPADVTGVVVQQAPASLGRGALATLAGLLLLGWLWMRARRIKAA